MGKEQLLKLVEPEMAENIIKVTEDILEYLEFRSVIGLGLNVDHKEMPFDKVMVYSWIKEELESGRKH
jgi:hypothetical protein